MQVSWHVVQVARPLKSQTFGRCVQVATFETFPPATNVISDRSSSANVSRFSESFLGFLFMEFFLSTVVNDP